VIKKEEVELRELGIAQLNEVADLCREIFQDYTISRVIYSVAVSMVEISCITRFAVW
jgi:hypothetical protein